MIKKVWFVSHFSMPPEYEMRIKTQMYAHYLGNKGIGCTIFSASTIHNTNINLIPGKESFIKKTYGDLSFVHIKCCNYRGNGFKRIINIKQFSHRFYKIASKMEKPDVIVTDCNCIGYKRILDFSKKYGVKVFLDIRDLWPLSIVEYMGLSKRNPLIRYLYSQEKRMYRLADGIIFTMEGGKQYLKDRGWTDIDENKIFHINNGIDFDEFEKNKQTNIYTDDDLEDSDSFKVIYVGAVRRVNGLKVLCDAANIIQTRIPCCKFLIFGDGDEKKELENYCQSKNINNVVFKGSVPKKYIPYILSCGDANILNYQVTKVIEYGACQNKLFDYLASGKITICNAKGKYNLLERYRCGILTKSPSPESTADAIVEAFNLGDKKRHEYGERAIEVAKKYDYKALTNQLLNIIDPDYKNE